jgi:hypothetical protein
MIGNLKIHYAQSGEIKEYVCSVHLELLEILMVYANKLIQIVTITLNKTENV